MNTEETIKNIRLYLFDMDGTLYIGDDLFEFTPPLLRTIRERGADYLFMTNNSSKSVEDYVIKLRRLGIESVYDDFITSSQVSAYYLKKEHTGAKVYICGTESLKKEFEKSGFTVTANEDEAECILMGYDTELTFAKLESVSRMLSLRDIPYYATNPDLVCPTEYGFVPDCGSVCGMIYNATGKKPVVIGKPEPLMPLMAMEKKKAAPSETAVVGDRIYTDIKSGINAGAVTVLVMSGETDQKTLDASEDKPDIVLQSCADILRILKIDQGH